MEKGKRPLVISISGVSGGGMTTIADALNDRLDHSQLLYFDDYEFDGPEDIIQWVDNGSSYDEWDLTPLVRDIQCLHKKSLDYILLDYPFAYKHSQIRDFIDIAFYIDTPLDIALARRLIRDFKNSPNKNILSEMEHYVTNGRRGYLEMLKSVRTSSDIIIDGSLSVGAITNSICEKILEWQKHLAY